MKYTPKVGHNFWGVFQKLKKCEQQPFLVD